MLQTISLHLIITHLILDEEPRRAREGLRDLLPRNPGYCITLTLNYTVGLDDPEKHLQYFSKKSGLGIRSAGKVGQCLLAAFKLNGFPPKSDGDFLAIFHEMDHETQSGSRAHAHAR